MRMYIAITAVAAVLAANLWLFQLEDPARRNAINAEVTALNLGLLPPDQGVTLALVEHGRDVAPHVVLVTETTQTGISGIDLTRTGLTTQSDYFEALVEVGLERLTALAIAAKNRRAELPLVQVSFQDLRPAAGTSTRTVASGTNFPEHLEETHAQSVFNFPKFGPATPPITTVAITPEELLDYEVEICARFDRDIETVSDFDKAQKGFFLCGDFSDRAVLTRLVDPDNFDVGTGFSDAKSGPDRFPSGGLFVVPRDWQAFVNAERLVTEVNGETRQDTRAGDMILSFRDLVEKVLADTERPRFLYKSEYWHLIEGKKIARGQVLMSGTAEGVIFMPPNLRQILRGVARYLTHGDVVRGRDPYQSVVTSFITEERQSGRYLQPNDLVTHKSSRMGLIKATVLQNEVPEVWSAVSQGSK